MPFYDQATVRGRRGKAMLPLTDHTQTFEGLALGFQRLVRELSHQTYATSASAQYFLEVPPSQPVPVSSSVTKMQSMREVSFRKSPGDLVVCTRSDSRRTLSNSTSGSACAMDVANLIMGLNPTPHTAPQLQPQPVPPLHCGNDKGLGWRALRTSVAVAAESWCIADE